jgi:predicted N-acetyltransferase YhbS
LQAESERYLSCLSRSSPLDFRTIQPHERGAVLDLLADWLEDRAFFARYFEHDPSFRDDLCFVAVDGGRIVSTLQVFRKRLRLLGATVEIAGVGNVFTAADHRDRGLASELITRASAAMEEHEFDLSLLFATRILFYGRFGWQSHPRELTFIEAAAGESGRQERPPSFVREFRAADLPAVMGIYDGYNAGRDGATVRDTAYWQGQLRYAGNPHEDFVVATDKGSVVAYARGTTLYGVYVIMEHGHLPGHEEALTQLVRALHHGPAAGLAGSIAHLSIAPAVQAALIQGGLTLRSIEDVFWMWKIVSYPRLAAKLGLRPAELEREDIFFRLLPPGRSLYWTSDRF